MAQFNIDISWKDSQAFVQTNFINSDYSTIMMSYNTIDISKEDAKELAKTLSSICNTRFEDENNNCIELYDGEIIKEYKNE